MADSHPPHPANGPVAKSRNPVERLIVWGLIGALLVAVAIEFQSRMSHQQALAALQTKIGDVDKDSTKPEVTEADIKDAIGDRKPVRTEDFGSGRTASNGAKRLEVYSWFTLNPTNKREIWVWYGAKGKNTTDIATVVEVQSSSLQAELPKDMASTMPQNGGHPMAGERGSPDMRQEGPRRGRPAAGSAVSDSDKPEAKTIDADKTGADNASEDKTAEDKTKKTDPDSNE